MKCSNCDAEALFIYETSSTHDQPYCNACLPAFLRDHARKGLLKTTEQYLRVKQELAAKMAPEQPKPAKKAKETAPVVDTPAPVDEEAPAEEVPAP